MGNRCTIATESCGFQCTGYDGSHRWAEMHAIVDGIECGTCRDHAKKSFSGFHDFINAGLGEKIYDKQNFKQFVHEVNCAYDSCKARGDCV